MWNPVSWNPTLREGRLFAKVVLKYEHINYVDPLASIPKGQHSSEQGYKWDPLYATCILV